MLTVIDGYEMVIGLEVHVQAKTNTKMFCGCKNEYGGDPNTHVCPVCLGLPGALPVPNEEAIHKTIRAGLMLGCDIGEICKFDRKNYFYPDMPKNYQITQYDLPFCKNGGVTLGKFAYPKEVQKEEFANAGKTIRLNRIHLEEDVAKSTHYEKISTIDFNRAGTPLMEIVSEADLRTAEEAFAYLTTLKQILNYGDISDADMEKGQLRCDVNVSVRPVGQEEFGVKCEVKNVNSFSAVRRAIEFEFQRQVNVIKSGGKIVQETRRWDDPAGESYSMRSKEQAHDYRYFPEPDMLPVRTEKIKAEVEKNIPELPHQKKTRLEKEFGVSEYQAEVLASDMPLCRYYETAAGKAKNKATVANWILNDFLATSPDTSDIAIPAEYFTELADLVEAGTINSKQAKIVFTDMIGEKKAPRVIVKEKGLEQMMDTGALEKWCEEAIAANPKSVEDFKSGKAAAINAFKGYVMKMSKGSANPKLVDEILLKKLQG
jgi:aspartyl-tRNA(Asn)/glutamyl-tRNA(Gln) amidotransferase subunit B